MIDCLIHKDELFKRRANENVFLYYENNELLSTFILTRDSPQNGYLNLYSNILVEKSECLFGNTKELKESHPELFI